MVDGRQKTTKAALKILQITPHLGGGVGKVLLNWVAKDKKYSHRIVCLDYANNEAKKIAQEKGIQLDDCFSNRHDEILKLIEETDIVILNFWNHPLLYDFLVREKLPPCRVIMWSHISGYHPPYVFTRPLFKYADLFVFTTQISYDTPEIKQLKDKRRLRTIWSTGGVDNVQDVKHKDHQGFNIGYIGTVDYCKLHPDFLEMSSKVDIPDARFIVVGCGDHQEIQQEANDKGWENKFQFLGFVDDIKPYLSIMDVFGYPLNPYHYGTCDQVLAEAMACGIVPVMLKNKMEVSMVEDGVTGFIVSNQDQYAKVIKRLHDDPVMRQKISENTQRYAKERFSVDKMMNEWNQLFDECIKKKKRRRQWTGQHHGKNVEPYKVFYESIGDYCIFFLDFKDSPFWQSKTKGTVHHYCSFFPEDKMLASFKEQMLNSEGLSGKHITLIEDEEGYELIGYDYD